MNVYAAVYAAVSFTHASRLNDTLEMSEALTQHPRRLSPAGDLDAAATPWPPRAAKEGEANQLL